MHRFRDPADSIFRCYFFDGLEVPEVFLVCSEAGGGLVEDADLEPRCLLLQQPKAGPGHHVGGHHWKSVSNLNVVSNV